MPLFEFECEECGTQSEILVIGSNTSLECRSCGSKNLKKILSVPSSLSGVAKPSIPQGAPCCASSPGEMNCPGPGSCCAKDMAY